ncbi:glycoside hydrolase family 128 protein [Acrodontium crateriforme]|uniref:Glycoside hydrolase family 128 protein n=1 Tax=Acrodontium crateriforme TaxID=150365 RepID=A0AAQ3RC54_9PEZI|nr:glycoside hydrolase family 128 protein [Acrodontium crateriforme]
MRPSKRGLCWPTENIDPVFPFTRPGSKISWIYNWSPNPTANATSLDFTPMQWNHIGIDDLAGKVQTTNASSILAYNEPELHDQSNMSANLAATEWLRCIEPLRQKGIRCGSPSISSAPHAIPWLRSFLYLIRQAGSDVDFYCLHWYGRGLGAFYDYIWSTHHQLGAEKSVWITEFACTNWNEVMPLRQRDVEVFAREAFKYLDGLDWVERYAWFGPMRNMGAVGKGARLLDDDGNLTDLGKIYRDE